MIHVTSCCIDAGVTRPDYTVQRGFMQRRRLVAATASPPVTPRLVYNRVLTALRQHRHVEIGVQATKALREKAPGRKGK